MMNKLFSNEEVTIYLHLIFRILAIIFVTFFLVILVSWQIGRYLNHLVLWLGIGVSFSILLSYVLSYLIAKKIYKEKM